MAHCSLAIVDEGSIAQLDTQPIGTGPYKFVEHIPGDKLVLEKFDDYFDKDTLNVRPQKVFIVPIREPQTRVAALKAGEIDSMVDVPFAQMADIAATSGVQLLAHRDGITASYMTVIFNYKEGPMADPRVQQAVQLAIDPIAINRAIYFELGVVSCNPILEDYWAYLPFTCPERDIEKANQLLQQAGFGPGELKLKYMPENIPQRRGWPRLPYRAVVMRHTLKNAMLTVVTIIALDFGLLTGALVTETVFRWPGVGLLLVDAIQTRDFAIIQMVVLVTTVTYILVNLAADIAYGYLNPRIRYE